MGEIVEVELEPIFAHRHRRVDNLKVLLGVHAIMDGPETIPHFDDIDEPLYALCRTRCVYGANCVRACSCRRCRICKSGTTDGGGGGGEFGKAQRSIAGTIHAISTSRSRIGRRVPL